jgi:ABC-type nickel/cobalt efflux system permease component RcnA
MIEALRAELLALWHWLATLQRDILGEAAALLRAFAETGDWGLLLAFAPWAVLFGAAHALTPGHSKTMLALWVAGTGAGRGQALRTAMTLASVHIGMSVAIVLLALPVVTLARGEAGRAPLLEDISRGLLALSGLWLVWQGLRGDHHAPDGRWFGAAAGLIPCPLTLFVMTFAAAHGVTVAGLGFAAMSLIGVALVLGTLAAAVAGFGQGLRALSRGADLLARGLMVMTGAAMLVAATLALAR